MKIFFEEMFFHPKPKHYLLMLLLLPLSLIYGLFMSIRRISSTRYKFGLPIVSVGNLVVGGSGKTPFVIALASRFQDVAVISRGYGRLSKGLVEVSHKGKIVCSVEQSGDEPMLMANSLPNSSVIVSENRETAIEFSKKQGAKVIFLDDGFNRVNIDKFELLLSPKESRNLLPFPAGPYREFFFNKKYADVVAKEGRDFSRVVEIQDETERMVLVTAISNPSRLDEYLPQDVVAKVYLEDHAYFEESVLKRILKENSATSLLCTSKDRVKMDHFDLPISEMKLKLKIDNGIIEKIEDYIYAKQGSYIDER